MLLHDGLDCSHEVLDVLRVMLRDFSSGRDEAARDIVDVLELASEFGVEIEADWAGRHVIGCILSVCQVWVRRRSSA